MENKKGFTLVELLAVIAILAILMLLIMPNVLNMFQNGRKDAFITQVQTVWRTANTQYVSSSLAGNPTSKFCDAGQTGAVMEGRGINPQQTVREHDTRKTTATFKGT